MWLLAPLLLISLLLSAAPAAAADCVQEVCVSRRAGNGVTLVATNNRPADVWVELWFTSSRNLFTPDGRRTTRIPAGKSAVVAHARPRDAGAPIDYRYRWQWSPGNPTAVHDDRYRYTLPVAENLRPSALSALEKQPQGAMPVFPIHEGEEITAARQGTVAMIRHSPADGPGPEPTVITLLHDDGTVADYMFYGAAAVRLGAKIRNGEAIGVVNREGYLILNVWSGSPPRRTPISFLVDDGSETGCRVGLP